MDSVQGSPCKVVQGRARLCAKWSCRVPHKVAQASGQDKPLTCSGGYCTHAMKLYCLCSFILRMHHTIIPANSHTAMHNTNSIGRTPPTKIVRLQWVEHDARLAMPHGRPRLHTWLPGGHRTGADNPGGGKRGRRVGKSFPLRVGEPPKQEAHTCNGHKPMHVTQGTASPKHQAMRWATRFV